LAPGSSSILAFYLGKAGSLKKQGHEGRGRRKGNSEESLRTRFNKYAVAGRLLGPSQEDNEKLSVFKELQKRGFSLWYRYGRGVGGDCIVFLVWRRALNKVSLFAGIAFVRMSSLWLWRRRSWDK
jgi:hypothetical protein